MQNTKPSLVILAAGRAKRFGSLKQLCKVGRNGKTISHLNILEAQNAGFGKIVFVIRKETEELFLKWVDDAALTSLDISFCFQEDRERNEKPWGTGHALLCARADIAGPFVSINADDFYGGDAFKKAVAHFNSGNLNPFLVAYPLKNTLSKNGVVNRAFIYLNTKNELESIREVEGINYEANQESMQPVSMNFWGFQPNFFDFLDYQFHQFKQNPLQNSEFQLPEVIMKAMAEKKFSFNCYTSNDAWFGLTYYADLSGLNI